MGVESEKYHRSETDTTGEVATKGEQLQTHLR